MNNRNPLKGPVYSTDRNIKPLDEDYCVEVVKHINQRMHPRYSLIIIISSLVYLLLMLWIFYPSIAEPGAPFFIKLFYTAATLIGLLFPAFVIGALYGIARGWSEVASIFLSGGLLYVREEND